jgi:two-component system, OmpR family, alkaline phosphatase synthesis response regulator PhoP
VIRKVLIAEDEPNIVASLEFILRQSNYEVRVARDGEEALRLVESFAPDLALIDIMMPRMSGFEVCRRIRGNPAWRDMKVMMLSAKGRDGDVGEGLGLGADAYVTKPFSTKALLARVHELLTEGA